MVRSAKKKTKIDDRRGAVRAERVVAIRHRLHQRSSKSSKVDWGLSTTKNMSLTGLLFWSDVPYTKGDILEISVTMSALIDIFQGYGEVVRVVQKAGKSFDVAISFVELKTKASPRKAKTHLK